jgi:hypothetical protein
LPFLRAFLIGTAIALTVLAVATTSARQVHAAAPVTVTAVASGAGSAESTLRAAVLPNVGGSTDDAGWVQYGAFGLVLVVLLVIGTGLVPRRRS